MKRSKAWTKWSSTALMVAFAGIIAKVVAFGREILLAKYFGASAVTDAYLLAITLPISLWPAVQNTITTALVPLLESSHGERKRKVLGAVSWHLTTLSALVVVAVMVWAPGLVNGLAGGLDSATLALAVKLTRYLTPVITLLSLCGILAGQLYTESRFGVVAWAGVFFNVTSVAMLVLLTPSIGIGAAVSGILMGAVVQFAIHWRSSKVWPLPFCSSADLLAPPVTAIWSQVLPGLLGVAAPHIGIALIRFMAAGLDSGTVSYLAYAVRVVFLPSATIAAAITTTSYTGLVNASAGGDWAQFRGRLLRAVQDVLFMMIPAMVLFVILRRPVVRLLYERGAFDATASAYTALALGFLAAGVVSLALWDLLVKVAFALNRSMRAMVSGAVLLVATAVLTKVLVPVLGLAGLALAVVLGQVIGCLLLVIVLRPVAFPWSSLGSFALKLAFATGAGAGLAAMVAALPVWARAGGAVGQLIICIAVGVAFCVPYGVAAIWFGILPNQMARFLPKWGRVKAETRSLPQEVRREG